MSAVGLIGVTGQFRADGDGEAPADRGRVSRPPHRLPWPNDRLVPAGIQSPAGANARIRPV
jgi:hypothetical protein